MKKILTIILAAALIACLAIPALAADPNTTEVSYVLGDSDQSYKVTIPSSLPASTTEPSSKAVFEFHDVNIVSSMTLTMTVRSANNWTLVNANEDFLGYDFHRVNEAGSDDVLSNNGIVLSMNGEGLEANASEAASCYAIITSGMDTIEHLGGFSDTLTITISISENAAAETEEINEEVNEEQSSGTATEGTESGGTETGNTEESSGGSSTSGSSITSNPTLGAGTIGQAGAAGEAGAPCGEDPRSTPDCPEPQPEPEQPKPYQYQR